MGDHYSLYEDLERQTDKLRTYASHFPVVELDASYYAIQPERNILKWINETPDKFQFIVKIHQALTLHSDYKLMLIHDLNYLNNLDTCLNH